ncbi:MAG: TetR/AcrR family transcriptional regulator [Myxococcales bacterium]|nr:TetR/AcrR family transcriptional regulator [Myxococcales bacterium]
MNHASPAPRRRRHRANLERLLEAATQIVFDEGVDALSIKKVADLADYTPGALYRYFPSKDALLAAVVARVLHGLAEKLTAAQGRSPLGRVAAQARVYLAFADDEPHAFALMSAMTGDPRNVVDDDASVAAILEGVVETLRPVAAALAEAASAGQLEPGLASDRALALFGALQGVMQLRKQERRAPHLVDVDRLFSLTLRALLRGFGASAESVDAALAAG